MSKLTKEEQLDRRRGYNNGRAQALHGRPWVIGRQVANESEIYKEAHRRGYLSVMASKGIVEPTEPKARVLKTPSNAHLAAAQDKGYEFGYEAGFHEALKALKEIATTTFNGRGDWSDQKMSGYQWGYRQAKAGNPPHSSGDLRSDPEFDDGYKMGYSAGSKILKSA